ncbi:hypothetical protein EV132_107148 [Rhizobium sullae]|uniref:Uncharacterized protein n=1 Tax=Rhizobium sullae TaxID=50338 RepID=A0A4R3Q2F1_RHISU|nr:hypothetical protein EV132_107148 [Rhizobium sullae]
MTRYGWRRHHPPRAAAHEPPFPAWFDVLLCLGPQWRRIEASHRIFVGKQAEVIGAVGRLPCLWLSDKENVSARRQPMVARQQRHFISFLTGANGVGRNPLQSRLSPSPLQQNGSQEARRRFMGVDARGKRHPDRRKCHSHARPRFHVRRGTRQPPRSRQDSSLASVERISQRRHRATYRILDDGDLLRELDVAVFLEERAEA